MWAITCANIIYVHSRRVGKATAQVNEALQQTALRRVEAQTKRDDLLAWEQAFSSAQQAKALAENGPVPHSLFGEVQDIARNIEEEHKQAQLRVKSVNRDAQMLKDLMNAPLESTYSEKYMQFDYNKTHTALLEAFLSYEIDLTSL